MAQKENSQVIALLPKNLEKSTVKKGNYALKMTLNLAAITSKNYNKFFDKIQKKLYPINELKQIISSQHHRY